MTGKPNPKFVITERRQKVLDLLSRGLSESEIATELNVGQSTISRDVYALNKESQDIIKSIERDYYPLEFRNIINSLRLVLKKSWSIVNDETGKWTNKDKINSMKLVIDASRTKFDILLNGTVNLNVEQLHQRLNKLEEDQETPKNFMPPLLHQNFEDWK